jgi:hypothetical protein
MDYNPKNWYWYIGDDRSQAYSSKSGGFVSPDDIPVDLTPTVIANEVELYDVLARAGLTSRAPSRSFTIPEVRDALLKIDAELTGNANTAADLKSVADEMGFILPPIA